MSYQEALAGIGVKATVDEHIGDYQGDWVAVVTAEVNWDDKLGFLSYGYGSCSGCDAWQAAETPAELAEIVVGMVNKIIWFETPEELREYIAHPNRLLSIYHEEGWTEFAAHVAKASDKVLWGHGV